MIGLQLASTSSKHSALRAARGAISVRQSLVAMPELRKSNKDA